MRSGIIAFSAFLKKTIVFRDINNNYRNFAGGKDRIKLIINKQNMAFVRPKKHLGQHFLKDMKIAGQIADTCFSHVSNHSKISFNNQSVANKKT